MCVCVCVCLFIMMKINLPYPSLLFFSFQFFFITSMLSTHFARNDLRVQVYLFVCLFCGLVSHCVSVCPEC